MAIKGRHAWLESRRGKAPQRSNDPRKLWRMCGHHQERWLVNRIIEGRLVSVECPKCIRDRAWAVQAFRMLQAEGVVAPTNEQLVTRAEQLAGYQLRRYNHD